MFCFPKFPIKFTDTNFIKKLHEIDNFDLRKLSDHKFKILQTEKTFHTLTEIIFRSSCYQLQFYNPHALITCSIRMIFAYTNSPFDFSIVISKKKCKTRFLQAKNNYIQLIKTFKSDKQLEVVNIIINILHEEKFWKLKRICVDMIKSLFDYGYSGVFVYGEICNKVEFCERSMDLDIKFAIKVMYELLDDYVWPENEVTLVFLKRFLNLYCHSLYDNIEQSKISFFINLRSSLELCIRHIIQNISNNHLLFLIQHMGSWAIREDVSDNFILNYSSTLEYAAYVHKADFLICILTADILPLLMRMISSNFAIVSLLGNRVLQNLIDRGKNIMLFNHPTIFYENIKLNININECYKEDKKFLKVHREIIHESLIKSFINHRYSRLNLETTYCTICLLAVEVPCGFTAAALSCLMMNLQGIIKKYRDQCDKLASYHIHAIIISVLSFVCWIHHAKDFYNYVNKIVMARAQWAPHLNPPLQPQYTFAQHHVLWDKIELYFVDWEVRYGLWKRFRLYQGVSSQTKSLLDEM